MLTRDEENLEGQGGWTKWLPRRLKNYLIQIGFIKYLGRHPYHVGWLAEGKTLEDLKLHLHSMWGFGINKNKENLDVEEVLNWCKISANDTQYFIRVYRDGEIRGYSEKTPKTGRLENLSDIGQKEAKVELTRFLGEFLVENKHVSNLLLNSNTIDPEPEILDEETEGSNLFNGRK